jgi:hypothetical protein
VNQFLSWRRAQGEEMQQWVNEAMVLKGKRRYPIDYETVTRMVKKYSNELK